MSLFGNVKSAQEGECLCVRENLEGFVFSLPGRVHPQGYRIGQAHDQFVYL